MLRTKQQDIPKELIRFCRFGMWEEFKQTVEQQHDAVWVGSNGQNILHVICSRHPSAEFMYYVLNKIQEYHRILYQQDADGSVPLHIAIVHGASDDVIIILIHVAPKTMFATNKWGKSPLDMIWLRYEWTLQDWIRKENPCASALSDKINDSCIMIEILMKSAMSCHETARRLSGNILHFAIDFHCPSTLLKLIINTFPEACKKKDRNGQNPLSRAVSTSPHFSYDVIEALIQAYPDAAKVPDRHGRYPLHWAASTGKDCDSMMLIFNHAPDVIRFPDPKTNLYPFMLSASSKHSSVTDIFELLILCPELVSI